MADPVDSTSHSRMYYFLSPKWGGSIEKQLAFARKVAQSTPQHSSAASILVDIHWYIYRKNNDPAYFKDPAVWEELKTVFVALTKHFPSSMKYHNQYARTAYLADDMEVAKREFEIIGDNWNERVWGSKEKYDEAKIKSNLLM
jgi:uncharacterized protein YneR